MNAPQQPPPIQVPPGILCLTTYGSVTADTTLTLIEMGRRAERLGLKGFQIIAVAGSLVDKTRNEAAQQLLRTNGQYLWFLDGDMSAPPEILDVMLGTAFAQCPWADIVGGWCALRGKPYLPTIDTGSGTWEPHDANIGPIEVIRTGGACLLIKRHVFERMAYPWFGVRPAPRPIDMLAEVDNYARIKFDGQNPLRGDAWDRLQQCAAEDAATQRMKNTGLPGEAFSSVGEDSNFADKAKALGFRIVVQTNAVCGHVDRHVIGPEEHQNAMRESRLLQRWAAGLLS